MSASEDVSNNLTSADNQEVIAADGDTGNFTELSNYISSEINAGNHVIELNKSYKYVDGDAIDASRGIEFPIKSFPLTINGNNHVLDGSDLAGIFRITSYESSPVEDNESVEVVPIILNVNKTAIVTVVSNDTLVTLK